MSVRDLIWVNVAQAKKLKRKGEMERDLWDARFKMMNTTYIALCDCRDLLIDTNYYTRVTAYKDTKVKKVEAFNVKNLPSSYIEEQREEEERRAKMTPEELVEEDVKNFMAGKTVRSR